MEESNNIQLEVLIDEFCRYYAEFESEYEKTDFAMGGGKETLYVTFGITGAGKSTTVARLISDLMAKDFYEEIQKRNGENKKFCTIESVTIGHRKTSQTVIPKVYTIKIGDDKLHICDMPGFNETDPQKRISIDVLQKCFLTKVHSAKFLVVTDISTLKETKMTTMMSHYDEPLSELLGDKYEAGIDHLYFILTRNPPKGQSNRMNEDDVERLTMQGARDFHKTKKTGTQLLYRLSERYAIVDLEEDDRSSLWNKIKHMIELDEVEKQKSSAITSFIIDKLEAGANILHEKCNSKVKELIEAQEKIHEQLLPLRSEVENMRSKLTKQCKKTSSLHKELLIQQRDRKAKLAVVRNNIKQYNTIKERLQRDLSERQDMLQVHTRQCKVFIESFEARDFINFRCDMSDYRRATFGSSSDLYKIDLNADVTSDSSTDRVILVLEYEQDDKTLKSHIGKGGSLIPDSLEVVKDMTGPSVLYNNQKHVNRIGVKIGPKDKEGVLSLSIKSKRAFKVFIYSSRPFKTLDYFQTLVQQFEQHKIEDVARIKKLEEELAALEKNHEEDLANEMKMVPDVSEIELKITQSKDSVSDIMVEHETLAAEATSKIDLVLAFSQELKGKSEVEKIFKIDKIFRNNNIETVLSEPLARFNSGFGRIERIVAELKDRIAVSLKEDKRGLHNIIGMTVGSTTKIDVGNTQSSQKPGLDRILSKTVYSDGFAT